MKKLSWIALMLVLASMLSACSFGKSNSDQNSAQKQVTDQKTVEGKTPGTNESPNQEQNKGNLPSSPTKKIPVYVEGEKEMREAVLTKSDSLGYQLYILKGFSLESEEPGKDVVISEYDGDFFARIEKLDNQVDLEQYKKQQIEGFSQVGKVTVQNPDTLFEPTFRDAKFCFLVEDGYEKNDQPKTSINYLVKEFDGQLFAITIFIPLKEAAEGISPSLWAMLATIEVR